MIGNWLALVMLGLILAGCGSTPRTDFYLLSADAPPLAAGSEPSVGIAELQIAEYLRRPEIVMMQSANRVSLEGFEHWAEPLDEGVRRTLELNLGALLGTDSVRSRPWPRAWQPDWIVRCNVARIDARARDVELLATWSVQASAGAAPVIERSSRLTRARTGDSADSLVADISALLLELSRQIADAIRTPAAANEAAADIDESGATPP